MSSLENLSHIDFEELCLDLAQAATGKRFSAFGSGPDGGIDGRYSEGDRSTIIQCKHYSQTSFSNLKSALRKEVINLAKLNPDCYLLFTSQSLTPDKSDILANILQPHLKNPCEIWGKEDIEAAIKNILGSKNLISNSGYHALSHLNEFSTPVLKISRKQPRKKFLKIFVYMCTIQVSMKREIYLKSTIF